MTVAFALTTLVFNLCPASLALVIIIGVIDLALIVVEGIICGKITAELVHKKDSDINEVLWFWLGFMFSWVAILLSLTVKQTSKKE